MLDYSLKEFIVAWHFEFESYRRLISSSYITVFLGSGFLVKNVLYIPLLQQFPIKILNIYLKYKIIKTC